MYLNLLIDTRSYISTLKRIKIPKDTDIYNKVLKSWKMHFKAVFLHIPMDNTVPVGAGWDSWGCTDTPGTPCNQHEQFIHSFFGHCYFYPLNMRLYGSNIYTCFWPFDQKKMAFFFLSYSVIFFLLGIFFQSIENLV